RPVEVVGEPLRHELRVVFVAYVVDDEPRIEVRREDEALAAPRTGPVLVQVVRAVAERAAAVLGLGTDRDDAPRGRVDHADAPLGRVRAVDDLLVGDDDEAATRER